MAQADAGRESDAERFVPWREFLANVHSPSLALVCLAVWLHASTGLVVATMLPAIIGDVDGAALVGWSVSLYETGSIVAGAAGALLTMRHGLRAPMAVAAVVFGCGALVSALGPSMPIILAGRALQGLGGGGLVAMSFVAVNALFPRHYIARAVAVMSTLWGVSSFLGPLVGGLFVEYASWRWGFAFFSVQAFGLATWIGLGHEPQHSGPSLVEGKFPWRRLALLCLAILLIAYSGVEVAFVQTTAFIVAGLLCLAGFLWLDERAGPSRMLPARSLDIRTPTGATLVMIFCFAVAAVAIMAFGAVLITAIHGVSVLIAGYLVACSAMGWTAMAVLVSGSPERLDRWMIVSGMSLVALSTPGFMYFVPNGPLWMIGIVAAIQGSGFGLSWTFILRRATDGVPAAEAQRISGAIPTVQRLGLALGAAYVGIVANANGFLTSTTPAEAASVARAVFTGSLPFVAAGLIAVIGLVRSSREPARARS